MLLWNPGSLEALVLLSQPSECCNYSMHHARLDADVAGDVVPLVGACVGCTRPWVLVHCIKTGYGDHTPVAQQPGGREDQKLKVFLGYIASSRSASDT